MKTQKFVITIEYGKKDACGNPIPKKTEGELRKIIQNGISAESITVDEIMKSEERLSLISGWYRWHCMSPEYKQMKSDNDKLCANFAAQVKTFTPHYSFVVAPYSQGVVVVNLHADQTTERERIEVRDKIIAMLGNRYCGWDYDGHGIALTVYFMGIDPKPYIARWEKRTNMKRV